MKVLVVIILVAIAGYFGYRILSKPKPAEMTIAEAQPAPESTSAPASVTISKPANVNNVPKPMTNRAVARTQETSPKPTGEWKTAMERILGSNLSGQQKIQDLRELLAKLEAEEAEAAVRELTSRVQDQGYAFLKPLAVDPKLPEPVRDEFMVDMMNRPNSVRVPLFLEIARNPDHPDHEHAFDNLEAFTGLKYGADWDGWEKGIQQWLKENPDRPRKSETPAPEPIQ